MLTEVILMCISKVNWWMPIKVILVYFKSDLLHTNRSDPNVYKCDLSLSLSLSLSCISKSNCTMYGMALISAKFCEQCLESV